MSIPGLNEPFPSRSEIVKPSRKASDVFIRWIENVLLSRLQASPVLAEALTPLPDQNAAAAGTLGVNLSGGLYRVDAHTVITVVDPVANSVQLTLGWTLNGLAYTETFTVLNSIVLGAAGTRQSAIFAMQVDPNTSVTYAYAYASNTPNAMHWQAALGLTLIGTIGA